MTLQGTIGRSICGCGPAFAALVGCLTLSANADAKSPSERSANGYVYLSPGLLAVPLGDDDFDDVADISYQWGLGGGALFRPKGRFGVGVGLGLEHVPLNIDGDVNDLCGALGNCDVDGHILRLLPEIRLGAVLDKVFVYGLIAPGLGLTFADVSGTALGNDFYEDDIDPGFNLGLAAGVQGFVWKRLALGGELGVDLGFYDEPADDDIFVDPNGDAYGAHAFDMKFLVGWYF